MTRLTLIEGLPFVAATITTNGYTVYQPRMLLDTGSAGTLVRRDVLDALHLELDPGDRIRQIIVGIGGTESVVEKHVQYVSVGDDLAAEPLVVEFDNVDYGLEMDGIIGVDFLLSTAAVIDLAALTVTPRDA